MQRTSDALQVGEENRVYREGGRRYVWSSIGKCIKRNGNRDDRFEIGSLSMILETCRKATIRAIELAKESGAVISFDPNFTSKKYSRVIRCFAEQQGLSLDATLDFFITLRSIS